MSVSNILKLQNFYKFILKIFVNLTPAHKINVAEIDYFQEKEKNMKLKNGMEKLEEELKKWRAGQTVSAEEQFNFAKMEDSMMSSSTTSNAPATIERLTAEINFNSANISLEDGKKFEEEREKLFKLLDLKDDEIQEQSQMVVKLKEQLLEQVSISPTFYERVFRTKFGAKAKT